MTQIRIRYEQGPWSWLDPTDLVRHALAAFYAACRQSDAETQPHHFCDDVLEILTDRLLRTGRAAGLPNFRDPDAILSLDIPENPAPPPISQNEGFSPHIHCRASHNENR